MLEVFTATMAFAVLTFSLLLTFLDSSSQAKSPLILLLSCMLLLSVGPIVFALTPFLIQFYVSILPLFFFSLLPFLWFYHEALIAQTYWQWQSKMWKHFIALPFVSVLSVAIFLLPESDFYGMFFTEQTLHKPSVLPLIFFLTVIFWCLLSFVYVFRLISRSIVYRRRLKNAYATEQGRDLKWVSVFSILILFTWLYALVVLVMDNRLEYIGITESGALLLFCLIAWFISVNGLRQRPGFEDLISVESEHIATTDKKTYQRSALTDEHTSLIAAKLNKALSEHKVHLDPELTLSKLSKILGEPTQYISQTLSQQLITTFFDFINQARIEDAKKALLESNQSVVNIALATGFNSRSSFYNAFKKYTGMTPSQYKKS